MGCVPEPAGDGHTFTIPTGWGTGGSRGQGDAGSLQPKGTAGLPAAGPWPLQPGPPPSTHSPVSLRLRGWRGLAGGLTAPGVRTVSRNPERVNEQELRGGAGAASCVRRL